jgi:PAS domain S-box-containing protein
MKRRVREQMNYKELAYQNEEKGHRADELIIANKELSYQNEEKSKRADELIIANEELAYQNEEKSKRADELIIANKELAYQNEEKGHRADELIIANKELAYQNEEKGHRADELIIANKELAYQNEEKGHRADELIIANKELIVQSKEKVKLAEELINSQKNAEIANEFNKNLLQTIPFYMDIIDKNGTILFSNKLLKDNVGDVIGKKCWNVHRDDKKQCVDCPLYSEIEIGKTKKIESSGVYGGKIFEISHTGIMFNGEKSILEIFQDITDRKQSENRLARAEIISKTGNWELYIDNLTMIASDGAKEIYGIKDKLEELKYLEIKKYVLSEYRPMMDDALKNLIDYNKPYNVEYKILTGDNEIKNIHSIANYDNINKIVFGVLQDVTIQKKNEEALEKSNAIKSIFLSNISHELRTPMTAIIGYSDLILSNNKDKDRDRFLKSINSNAKHLDELLNNILDYSKIESDTLDILYEDFSILDLFEELSDIFEDENYKKNLDFVKLEFSKKNYKITSDYLRLKQVLYNIISNSIKFTENGYIKVSFVSDKNFVTFKIEDTGIGIQKDKLPLVFDRFWQCDSTSKKKYKGTGLGLSISKSIVEILNGQIWLESELNVGTTFYVKIPIEEQKLKIIKIEPDFPGKTILVIDDVPITYSILGIYLNSLHINIISSTGGKESIEIYKKQKEKIDLIILDLNLFDMSSFELIKTMKEICDCKIISKSGIENQKNELVDYHLKKPINKNILVSIFNEIWQK